MILDQLGETLDSELNRFCNFNLILCTRQITRTCILPSPRLPKHSDIIQGATGNFFQIHRMRNMLEPSLCPLQLVLYSMQYWHCSHVIFSSVRWRGSRVSSGKYPGLRLSKPSSKPRVPFNSCLLQLRSVVSALQLRFPQVSNSSRDADLLGLLGVIKWDHLWKAFCTQ